MRNTREKIITTQFQVNNKTHTVKAYENTPLLTILRDHLHLKGTKYGCGKGICGACSVHKDGELIRSCSFPLSQIENAHITTIEGIPPDHPIKKIWIDEKVMQCGFCQGGQILCALTLTKENPHPSPEDIENSMTHICRCGTYSKIKKAVLRYTEKGTQKEGTQNE